MDPRLWTFFESRPNEDVTLPALEKKLPIKVSRFDVSFSNLTERIALASFPTHSYTNAIIMDF